MQSPSGTLLLVLAISLRVMTTCGAMEYAVDYYQGNSECTGTPTTSLLYPVDPLGGHGLSACSRVDLSPEASYIKIVPVPCGASASPSVAVYTYHSFHTRCRFPAQNATGPLGVCQQLMNGHSIKVTISATSDDVCRLFAFLKAMEPKGLPDGTQAHAGGIRITVWRGDTDCSPATQARSSRDHHFISSMETASCTDHPSLRCVLGSCCPVFDGAPQGISVGSCTSTSMFEKIDLHCEPDGRGAWFRWLVYNDSQCTMPAVQGSLGEYNGWFATQKVKFSRCYSTGTDSVMAEWLGLGVTSADVCPITGVLSQASVVYFGEPGSPAGTTSPYLATTALVAVLIVVLLDGLP